MYPVRHMHRFVMLFNAGALHRKGIDLLLSAFFAEFEPEDDACLIANMSYLTNEVRFMRREPTHTFTPPVLLQRIRM